MNHSSTLMIFLFQLMTVLIQVLLRLLEHLLAFALQFGLVFASIISVRRDGARENLLPQIG